MVGSVHFDVLRRSLILGKAVAPRIWLPYLDQRQAVTIEPRCNPPAGSARKPLEGKAATYSGGTDRLVGQATLIAEIITSVATEFIILPEPLTGSLDKGYGIRRRESRRPHGRPAGDLGDGR
jgi:hypothetical protein